jgi:hypothetical protein
MRRPAVVVVVVLAASAAVARADSIGPPPSDCPRGTAPIGLHWSTCEPVRCTSDVECPRDQICEPLSLCVVVHSNWSGWAPADVEDARSECSATDPCPPDVPCMATHACVAGARPPVDAGRRDAGIGGVPSPGCGCGIARRPRSFATLSTFFLINALVVVRALWLRGRKS